MNEKETYLLAVYGSLKRGYFNSGRLASSKYLGDVLLSPKYTMIDLGGYPAVITGGATSIHCEVYQVSKETFIDIGRMEMSAGYKLMAIDTKFGKACLYIFAYPEEVKSRSKIVNGNWKQPQINKWPSRRIRGI